MSAGASLELDATLRAALLPAPRARDLLDALPFAVVAVARELLVIAGNREAERLLGVDLTAGPVPLPEPWAELSLRRFARRAAATGAVPVELRAPVDGGRVVELVGLPTAAGAVLLVRDISAYARREEADRAFVANASHELVASLAGISSAVEALELGAKDDPPARDELVGGLATAVRGLRGQVEALLVLARAHAEPRLLSLETVRLASLVEEVAATLPVRAGVCVRTESDDAVASRAHVPLLEVAFRNVARNAAAHAVRGTITLACRREEGARVALEVADEGPGLPSERRTRPFERFGSGSEDGFGIGLSLTRQIAHLLGGDVEVESGDGGTRVRIMLPAA